MRANLLLLLFMSCSIPSASLLVRPYYDTELSAITKSTRLSLENSTVCEQECDEKQCYGYNYNNGICQIFDMMSSTTQFQCSRPIKAKVASPGCSYELASVDELCLDCEKMVVAQEGNTLRASCTTDQLLVFVTEFSAMPRLTTGPLECVETGSIFEWTMSGTKMGSSPKMGCTRKEAADLSETCTEQPMHAKCSGGDICAPYIRIPPSDISPRLIGTSKVKDALGCPDFFVMQYGDLVVTELICARGRYRMNLADNSPLQDVACARKTDCPTVPTKTPDRAFVDLVQTARVTDSHGVRCTQLDAIVAQDKGVMPMDSRFYYCGNKQMYATRSINSFRTSAAADQVACLSPRGGLALCVLPTLSLVDLECPIAAPYCEMPYRWFMSDGSAITAVTLQCDYTPGYTTTFAGDGSGAFCDASTGGWIDKQTRAPIKNFLCVRKP